MHYFETPIAGLLTVFAGLRRTWATPCAKISNYLATQLTWASCGVNGFLKLHSFWSCTAFFPSLMKVFSLTPVTCALVLVPLESRTWPQMPQMCSICSTDIPEWWWWWWRQRRRRPWWWWAPAVEVQIVWPWICFASCQFLQSLTFDDRFNRRVFKAWRLVMTSTMPRIVAQDSWKKGAVHFAVHFAFPCHLLCTELHKSRSDKSRSVSEGNFWEQE